ncbi:hypothetical protein, partial [Bifidobacterium longum]|uniref:hypothetical protein n=1 Tax=Bifidobacterium longum TaxID=216816 RepID=UPI001E550792
MTVLTLHLHHAASFLCVGCALRPSSSATFARHISTRAAPLCLASTGANLSAQSTAFTLMRHPLGGSLADVR